ncbi:MAG: HU family DNA-binding protein [Clostridiales bacterium]|nr:HU family DNA-binding protein [Clostridiales bacterium]
MNKADLISVIAQKSDLSRKDAEKAMNAFIETVTETLKKNEKVQIVGFGIFEPKHREARKGHNPMTGAEIDIPASNAPSFKAGKAFKEALN